MNLIKNSTGSLPPEADLCGTNLSITVKNGVATLFGNTESGTEASLAENLIIQMHGVNRVINLITYN